MLFILEIAMFIMGIVAMIMGKLSVTRTLVVKGTPARIAGLLWFLPLPLAVIIGLAIVPLIVTNPTQANVDRMVMTVTIIEVGLIVTFLIAGIVVAAVAGNKAKKRRLEEDYDDEEEDRAPIRRRRPRDEDADEEEGDLLPVVEEVEPAAPPDTILAQCPNCKASYRLPASLAGKKARCKNCQEVFPVEKSGQGIQATAPQGRAPRRPEDR